MRLHCLQHAAFESPGTIESWAVARGFDVVRTRLDAGAPLPEPSSFDWLVVMGGPMNVYEDETCPWLPAEKALIDDAVAAGKVVLGVCLGAQLLADVLGGRVTRNEHTEIGWFPVTLTAAGLESVAFGRLPAEFTALHWHGDTFSLPDGATRMAESAATPDQAFRWGRRAFGVQFHLECTAEGVAALVRECGDELVDAPWIQPAERILGREDLIEDSRRLMEALLDGIADEAGEGPW